MDPAADIASYIASVQATVTVQTTPDSIDPIAVGNIGEDLATLLLPYLELVATGANITFGDSAPSGGADGDYYVQGLMNAVQGWKKINGVWTDQGTSNIGPDFPDGPITGLRAFIEELDVTVTPGSWAISNVRYQKLTQTQFTVPAADLNYLRYDLIYADDNNDVGYTPGVASTTPAYPTPAAGQIVVDYVVVPSSASGQDPYLLSGGQGGGGGTGTEFQVVTSDSSGVIDLSGFDVPEYPVIAIYDMNGLTSPAQYDNTTKTYVYANPSETYRVRWVK